MSRRKLYRIIIEAGAAVLLIFVLVFFLGFRVTSVQVEGNSFYTDDEIKNMVTNVPLAKNLFWPVLLILKKVRKTPQ